MEFLDGLWYIIENIITIEIPLDIISMSVKPIQIIIFSVMLFTIIKILKAFYGADKFSRGG